jgi:hypothetical protein
MVWLALLIALGAVTGVVAAGVEVIALAAVVSRPVDAAPLILTSAWAVGVFPLTFARQVAPSDARVMRRWLALSFAVPPLAAAIVCAIEFAL